MTELPLVLLHAFPLDSRMWNDVRAPLSSVTRFITPDQRGLGRTPLPESGREPDLADAARDVVALLDQLEIERAVLGGCSMGGYLTMAVLRVAPERVGGLVLIDTRAGADPEQAAANRRAIADRAESEGHAGWLAGDMLPNLLGATTRSARPELAGTVRELVDGQDPAGIAWAQRAMAARPDSTETLRGADVPALVLVGEEDTLTTPEVAREMAEVLPDAEFAVLPAVGHLSPMESPATVADTIAAWLPSVR
ncbi:alpha/beta hydrolase [Amycolatopsis antarctica]|uniref:Alpha/beta hydrolase n=1 Tax=Amycolatopsis antarctica TaxID=1854586 RepID=A0A263D5T3_9PSEU|nr:alpha/beta hydrolase [Amycolatopsis antarctica]OZM73864.1 alpha/beta hydrolase [Amycolatopsis antarctica]